MSLDEQNFIDVFWADLLYEKLLDGDPGFVDDEKYVEAVSLKKYDDGWLDRLRAEMLDVAGDAFDKIKRTFGMDEIAGAVLAAKLKDLSVYYEKTPIKDRNGAMRPADVVLREELSMSIEANKDKEIILIAHSMGTIIAYDVLCDLKDSGISIPHFITIGSPLGLPHVAYENWKRLGEPSKMTTPDVVAGSWMNFADRKDPVAVDVHLRDDYEPNARGVAVVDDLILNDYTSNQKANHHKHFGYLRAPEVSEHLAKCLGLNCP